MPNAPARRKVKSGERLTACQRGYDRRWRKCRRLQLELQPLCEDCLEDGQTVIAQEVHHKRPVRDVPSQRLTLGNLMSLCKRHHSIRTIRGE